MTSKTLAAGLIASWLFVLLSGAAPAGNQPGASAPIDESTIEFRHYV
jgi:hypothetical protein